MLACCMRHFCINNVKLANKCKNELFETNLLCFALHFMSGLHFLFQKAFFL